MSFTPTSGTPRTSIDHLYLNRHNIRQIAEKLFDNSALASQVNKVSIRPDVVGAPSLPMLLGACVGMSHLILEGISVSLATISPLAEALSSMPNHIRKTLGPYASTHQDLRPLSRVQMLELRSCTLDDIRPLMWLMSLCPGLELFELLGCSVGALATTAFRGKVPRLRKLIVRATSGLSGRGIPAEGDMLNMLLPLAGLVELRVGTVGDVSLSTQALLALGGSGVQHLRIDGSSWDDRATHLQPGMLVFCPALRTLNLRSLTLAGMPLIGPEAPAVDWVVPLLEATPTHALERIQIEVEVDRPGYAPRANTVDWKRVDYMFGNNARCLRQISIVLAHSLVDNAEMQWRAERLMASLAAAIEEALANLNAKGIVAFTMGFRDPLL